MSRSHGSETEASLLDALHDLSQPLTTMSLALTLAQTSSSEAERAFALETAAHECGRAMTSMRQLRALVNRESVGVLPHSPIMMERSEMDTWKCGELA